MLDDLKPGLGPDQTDRGLWSDEAARRLTDLGSNEIVETRESPLRKFLSYFWGPIPWMIEAAAVLSALARDWPNFLIILAMLALALIVWGYALVWFLVNNMVKRLVVHLLSGAGPGAASRHISEITA